MNGLQYIRIRCNFSLAELAKQLGITRQAVSAREWAKKIREENSKLSREELIRKAEKEIKENGKVGKGTVNTHYTQ